MPDTWNALKFVKDVPSVIHRGPKNFARQATVLQLLREQRMMEFPCGRRNASRADLGAIRTVKPLRYLAGS